MATTGRAQSHGLRRLSVTRRAYAGSHSLQVRVRHHIINTVPILKSYLTCSFGSTRLSYRLRSTLRKHETHALDNRPREGNTITTLWTKIEADIETINNLKKRIGVLLEITTLMFCSRIMSINELPLDYNLHTE